MKVKPGRLLVTIIATWMITQCGSIQIILIIFSSGEMEAFTKLLTVEAISILKRIYPLHNFTVFLQITANHSIMFMAVHGIIIVWEDHPQQQVVTAL